MIFDTYKQAKKVYRAIPSPLPPIPPPPTQNIGIGLNFYNDTQISDFRNILSYIITYYIIAESSILEHTTRAKKSKIIYDMNKTVHQIR